MNVYCTKPLWDSVELLKLESKKTIIERKTMELSVEEKLISDYSIVCKGSEQHLGGRASLKEQPPYTRVYWTTRKTFKT